MGNDMSQTYSSTESILAMLDKINYTKDDIKQGLADLDEMKNSISTYKYLNIKALIETKL
ncbi:MAG: hypothetical protein RR244_04900 [Oscillospiraceae bacterium]